ncbi:MAG: hypothetical protein ACM3O3_06445 [Syntrophothermus sp.]
MSIKKSVRNAWAWVPSLYYAEGIPYVVVMLVSVIMYKRMGVSNASIAFYTSLLYLPWVLKPLWSPFIDLIKTKRFWIIIMQLIVGAGLAGVAFTIPMPNFLQWTLAFFFLLAISSATHDIAADGFYMLGLSEHDQAFYVGIRSTFYRLSMITGQGLLIILAGYFETHSGLPPVEVQINAMKTNTVNQIVLNDSISAPPSDKLSIISDSKNLTVSNIKRNKAEVDSIVHLILARNINNGFYNNLDGKPKVPELKINDEDRTKSVGNIGVISYTLSQKPQDDKDYVMNIDHSGDKSISIIEGTRFVFNKNNWNKPAYTIVQLDPKLRNNTSAEIRAIAGDIPWAWSVTFMILTGLFIAFFIYHKFILPYPVTDVTVAKTNGSSNFGKEFVRTFKLFFTKPKIGLIITFLLIYRFGEAQLIKLASPFLLDPREVGGLSLTTGEVGLIYGTIGVIFLTLGGIVGGMLASKDGLRKWIWWMFAAINIPHVLYIYLSFAQPDNFAIISLCVAGEQFGYGFGFTAYMLYMIYASEGEFKTSHYAICTGFMALSMMLPGLVSGYIQEFLGYKLFFVWILLTMIPGFFIIKMIPLDPNFGKKTDKQ